MTTERKFAAFAKNGRQGLGISKIPKDGFCISVFLIVRQKDRPRRVLMGKLNPEASWDHFGALTPDRIEAHSHGWMLPSCHLLYGESPHDAARRVAREQLGLDDQLELSEPKVYSEVYEPKRYSGANQHWDLEFVYEAYLQSEFLNQQTPKAWRKLEFIDIDSLGRSEYARSHEDIVSRVS